MSGILAKSGRTSSRMKRVLKQAQAQSPGVFLRTSTHMASTTLDPSTLANVSLAERLLSGTERLGAASINEDVMKTFVGTLHAASSLAQHHQHHQPSRHGRNSMLEAEQKHLPQRFPSASTRLHPRKPILDRTPISNNLLLSRFDQVESAVLDNMDPRPNAKKESGVYRSDKGTITTQEKFERNAKTLNNRLTRAIKSRRLKDSLEIFEKAMVTNAVDELDSKIYQNLIKFMAPRDVLGAYSCLKRYENVTGNTSDAQVYGYICNNLDRFDPGKVRPQHMVDMTRSLIRDLEKLDEAKQHWLFPQLVLSLTRQPFWEVGKIAAGLYRRMVKEEFPLTAKKLEQFVRCSKYARQKDLPYHEILEHIASKDGQPHTVTAIHALENLFPFTDTEATMTALGAIIDMQSTSVESESNKIYRIDIGALEHITAAAARKPNPDLNLLVWDALELFGYEPTETIYENTIQSFCMSYRKDDNCFEALAEMESKGFEPSRALIRSVSRSLRYSASRVDNAYYIVSGKNHWSEPKWSVGALNIVLSACGELGDVNRAFATFDEFEPNGLKPNLDSYCFLFEALDVDTDPKYRKDSISEEAIQATLEAAEYILSAMKADGIELAGHALQEYVHMLINIEDIDKALETVTNALEANLEIRNKTFFTVAMACCNRDRFDDARYFSSKLSELWNFLDQRINKMAETAKLFNNN